MYAMYARQGYTKEKFLRKHCRHEVLARLPFAGYLTTVVPFCPLMLALQLAPQLTFCSVKQSTYVEIRVPESLKYEAEQLCTPNKC